MSLTDYDPNQPGRLLWYNILNIKYLQDETQRCNSSLSNASMENGGNVSSSSSSGVVVATGDMAGQLMGAESSRMRKSSNGDSGAELTDMRYLLLVLSVIYSFRSDKTPAK